MKIVNIIIISAIILCSCSEEKLSVERSYLPIVEAQQSLYEEEMDFVYQLVKQQYRDSIAKPLRQLKEEYENFRKLIQTAGQEKNIIALKIFRDTWLEINNKLSCPLKKEKEFHQLVGKENMEVVETAARLTLLLMQEYTEELNYKGACLKDARMIHCNLTNNYGDSATIKLSMNGYQSPLFKNLDGDSLYKDGQLFATKLSLKPDSNIYTITLYNLSPGEYKFSGFLYSGIYKIPFRYSFRK